MRKRNIREIITVMGDKTEQTIELINGESLHSEGAFEDYEEHVLELFELLKKLDEKEIENARTVLGREDVVDAFLEIHKDIDKAEKFLENRNKQALLKYLKRILDVEKKLYEDMEIQTYDGIEIDESLGGGIEGVAYLTENGKVLKVWSSEYTDLMDLKRFKNQIDQVPERVNIATIEGVGLYQGSPATLMEKAPGIPVSRDYDKYNFNYERWRKANEKLAEGSRSHYEDLKRNMDILRKNNISVDTVRPDNIFYHDEEGFTFIDVARDHSRVKKKYQKPYSDYSSVLLTFTNLEAYVEWLEWVGDHPERVDENFDLKKDCRTMETIIEKLLDVGFQRYERFDEFWNKLQNMQEDSAR